MAMRPLGGDGMKERAHTSRVHSLPVTWPWLGVGLGLALSAATPHPPIDEPGMHWLGPLSVVCVGAMAAFNLLWQHWVAWLSNGRLVSWTFGVVVQRAGLDAITTVEFPRTADGEALGRSQLATGCAVRRARGSPIGLYGLRRWVALVTRIVAANSGVRLDCPPRFAARRPACASLT